MVLVVEQNDPMVIPARDDCVRAGAPAGVLPRHGRPDGNTILAEGTGSLCGLTSRRRHHRDFEGAVAAMIPIPSGVRVWIATGHTDMRRGMQGLALAGSGELEA